MSEKIKHGGNYIYMCISRILLMVIMYFIPPFSFKFINERINILQQWPFFTTFVMIGYKKSTVIWV